MKQTKRRLVALVPAFVLLVGLALPPDRVSQICAIAGDIVYCAPDGRDPQPS